jgi:protein-tyrosine phosphatase
MIDLHSHLLPGIDDGATDLQDALRLSRHAVSSGITHMVMTPHIHPGRYENDIHSINAAHDQLRSALESNAVELHTTVAAEVRVSVEMIAMISQSLIPFLGELDGYKIILLEFPHSHVLPGTDKLISLLLKQGIRPMIAHPERNKDVIRDLNKIRPFVDMGCLLQVTAGSVAGNFGEPARERAEQILSMGWAHVLASDAHNDYRLPELNAGREAAAAIVGEEASWQLVRDNPWAIVGQRFTAG